MRSGVGMCRLPEKKETIANVDSAGATGIPCSCESASSQDHTVGLCLGPYGGPRGGQFLMSEVALYCKP